MNKLIKLSTIMLTTLILCLSVFSIPTTATTGNEQGDYAIDLNVNPNPIRSRTVTTITVRLDAAKASLDADDQFEVLIPKAIVNDNGISFQGGTDGVFSIVSNQIVGENYQVVMQVAVDQINDADFIGDFTLQFTTVAITQNISIIIGANYGVASSSKTIECISGAIINTLPSDLYGWTSAGLTSAAIDADFPQYGAIKSILPSPNGDSSAQFANGQSGTMFRMLFNSKDIEQTNAQATITIPSGWQTIELHSTNGFPGSVGVVSSSDLEHSRIGNNMVRIASMNSNDTSGTSLQYYTNYSNNSASISNSSSGGSITVDLGTIPAGKSFYIDFGLQYVGHAFTKDVMSFKAQSDQQNSKQYLGITFPKMSADSASLETSSMEQQIYNDGTIDLVTKVYILKTVHREELSVMLPLTANIHLQSVNSIKINNQESAQVAVSVQNEKLYIKNTEGDLQTNDIVEVSYTLNTNQPNVASLLQLTPRLELSAGSVNGNTVQVKQETFDAQEFSIVAGTISNDAIVSAAQVASSDSTLAIRLKSVLSDTGQTVDLGNIPYISVGNYTVVFQGKATNGKQVETEARMNVLPGLLIPETKIPNVDSIAEPLLLMGMPPSSMMVIPAMQPQVTDNWDLYANASLAEYQDDLFHFYSVDKYFVLRAVLLSIVLIPVFFIFLVIRKVKKMSDQSDELIYKKKG